MLHGTEAGSASDGGDRCQLDELCISLADASALVRWTKFINWRFLLTFLALWFSGVCPTNCWGWSPVYVGKFQSLNAFFFLTLGQNLEDAVNIILNLCKYMKEKTFVWNFLGLCKVCTYVNYLVTGSWWHALVSSIAACLPTSMTFQRLANTEFMQFFFKT